jgi:predicted DNA-binding transcriptional regulator AlpA
LKPTQKKPESKHEGGPRRRDAFPFEVGVPDVELSRRVIDADLRDFVELIDARLAHFLEGGARPANEEDDGARDRAGAARFLGISLSTLDSLCRREQDPLPFHLCGDSRRFLKDELRAWLLRQGGNR